MDVIHIEEARERRGRGFRLPSGEEYAPRQTAQQAEQEPSMKQISVEQHEELGYRLPDGREMWEVDHGSDGVYIPANRHDGIPAINIFSDGQDRQRIVAGLTHCGKAGAQILSRSVLHITTETEVIAAIPGLACPSCGSLDLISEPTIADIASPVLTCGGCGEEIDPR